MKIKSVVFLCAMLIFLTSCEQTNYVQGDYSNTRWVSVYYAAEEAGSDEEVIRAEKCEIPQGDLEQTIYAIYSQSCSAPISNSLKSPIPRDAKLKSVEVENGTVTLDLSREYGAVGGFGGTIADYCLAMSLCELEGVKDVTILVEGAPLSGRKSNNLTPDDVVLADLNLVGFSKKLKLYFPDMTYTELSFEMRDVISKGTESEALLVLRELVEGPSQRGLRGIVPYGTQVNSVKILGKVCVIDFSSEFMTNPLSGENAEQMCIRAIAKSLSEIGGIEKMQIFVDGENSQEFSNIDISEIFVIEEYIK